MIRDEVVEEVRARADLVEVVSEKVDLKRSGKDWKGRCPFHEDRTPSFYVVPVKGFYTCFGCGASGDVFDFIMRQEGMEFVEAVKHLGARYGVDVPELSARDEASEDPLRLHYEANAFAREYFQRCLNDPEGGAGARAYLDARGIDENTRERFGIGFAPDAWRGLREAAGVHGIPDWILEEVGLLTRSERSPEPYDRFRNRILFPIESGTGRVLGFGGRVLGAVASGVPKYLNSPETVLYHKGEHLYALGWNVHAIRKEGVALLTEGYMDVVSLAAGGVGHAVAVLGTALTPEQARLLRRYAPRVVLLFDSDEAGLKATFRAADILLAVGIHPAVATLPKGEDPDSLIRKAGKKGIQEVLDAALDVVDRKLQLLDEKGFFRTIDGVRVAVDKLLPTLRATIDPTLRDIYVSRVSERCGVRRETLEEELEGPSAPSPSRGPRPEPGGARGGSMGQGPQASGERPAPRTRGLPPLGAERKLLLVLLRSRDWVDRALERIGPEEFQDPAWRAIFHALLEDPGLTAPPPGMSETPAARLEELLSSTEDLEHTERIFEDCLWALQDRALRARQKEVRARLETETDSEVREDLMRQLQQLSRERGGRPGGG